MPPRSIFDEKKSVRVVKPHRAFQDSCHSRDSMKILVTGAAGFLGGHVAEGLLQAGHEVIAFDLEADNRPHLCGARSVRGDLLDATGLAAACRGSDAICHLGGVGDVMLAGKDPARAAAANVVGTANIMAAARAAGVSRLVYASTWEVYGEPRYQPIDEDHPCSPDHPYNITKLAGELLALAGDRLGGVPTIALRLGTAYGARMRPNTVFSRFIDAARRGEAITIQGTGFQSRQFTHARDIARGFRMAIESDVHGEAINLVADESITIRSLAEMVVARFPTELRYTDARAGDVSPATIDSRRARSLLGWHSSISFDEGLGELLDHAGRRG
jgi:UDP-glucose 4-epimerase